MPPSCQQTSHAHSKRSGGRGATSMRSSEGGGETAACNSDVGVAASSRAAGTCDGCKAGGAAVGAAAAEFIFTGAGGVPVGMTGADTVLIDEGAEPSVALVIFDEATIGLGDAAAEV